MSGQVSRPQAEEVARLLELAEKATPGPWWVSHHPDNVEHFLEPEVGNIDEDNEADADLIVAAVNLVVPLARDWQAMNEAIRAYIVAIARAPNNRDEAEIERASESLVAAIGKGRP